MRAPLLPDLEPQRLEALRSLALLDTPPELDFDDFSSLAASLCQTPMALISLVDAGRLWFKSREGLDVPETPRGVGFCSRTILGQEIFEIPDALADERFADNPLVAGAPRVRFYAGAPLVTGDGHALGALAVLDRRPRLLSSEQRRALLGLARQASNLLALRRLRLQFSEARERERDLLDHSLDAIGSVDASGRFRYTNEALRRLLGYSAEELSRLPLASLFPEHRRPGDLGQFEPQTAGPRMLSVQMVTRQGQVRDLEGSCKPWGSPGEGGELRFALRDVTEQRKAIQALVEANAELELERLRAEEASRAKSMFLATMSHDIRTPMSGVIGMANILGETELDPTQREYVDTICRSGEMLLALTSDILDFSKIEAGMIQMESEAFDPASLLEDVAEMLVSTAIDKGIELCVQIAPAVPARIAGDRARLRQVLVNLVSNAIKFTSKGGVWLSLRLASPGELLFEVRDSGIGIAPEAMTQIFEPFSQADRSINRRFGGTGLGLAICHRLVGLMGGQLRLDSELDKGTTFWFSLRAPAPLEDLTSPGLRVLPDLHRKRVLVLDPSPQCRAYLESLLGQLGAVVEEGGCEQGPALLGGEPFALALCEMESPRAHGLLRQVSGGAPTIALVWPGDTDRHRQALALGAAGVLLKPVRRQALFDAVSAALGRRQGPDAPVKAPPRLAERYPLRLLLAEDNPTNRKVARLTLKRLGYEIDVVEDGAEALRLLRANSYDVVLMDIHMPGVDGLEATRQIRQTMSVQPWIVAMTASAMVSDREACLGVGMNDYISKPIVIDELARALRDAYRASRRGASPP